ncbi:hypothetical protein EBZ80_23750 [bacterium]|nr:hypothetical protein [bacterium]
MSLANLLPTTSLAPYSTSFSLLAAPAQNLQQFPQHVSNAPGQTVDYFFNVLSVLLNLSQTILNSAPSGSTLAAYATEAVGILGAIIDHVQVTFAKEYQWSSPILPYKGWAANNCVQSATNPLNVSGISTTLAASSGENDVTALTYILYYYLYAFNTEVQNLSIQINQHTYAHLVNNTPAFSYNGSAPESVSFWVDKLTTDLAAILPAKFFNTIYSPFPLIQSSVFNIIQTATVETLEHIPLYYLTYPQGPARTSAATYTTLVSEGSVILLIIFLGLLYNTFSAITPALNKVDTLYDPKTHEYIFSAAAGNIAHAFATFSSLAGPVNTSVTKEGDASNALSTKQFSYAITYTQKSARTSSIDVNRIDGSLVPTLKRLLQLWQSVRAIAQEVLTLAPSKPAYNSTFIADVTNLITGAPSDSITKDIQDAIDSFSGQLNIHYSRWSQNLTNI